LQPTEVAFLGFAERASLAQEGGTPFSKWNIIGLKQTLLTFVFPLSFVGIKLAVALRPGSEAVLKLSIRSDTNEEIGWFQVNLTTEADALARNGEPSLGGQTMFVDPMGWTVVFFEIGPEILITRPGHYSVVKLPADGSEVRVGTFNVLMLQALPLDADRIAAI